MHFSSVILSTTFLGASSSLQLKETLVPTWLSTRHVNCSGTEHKQFQPTLRTVNNADADPTVFHVRSVTGTKFSQIMTFPGLPPTATNFYLQWAQSASPKEFTTIGAGTVAVFLLNATSLPLYGNSTQLAVEAAIDLTSGSHAGRVGSAAFGGWPEFRAARNHLVGAVNATGQSYMSFYLVLQEQGDVRLVQDEVNGWFLKYDC
jgi:hypothetical protein